MRMLYFVAGAEILGTNYYGRSSGPGQTVTCTGFEQRLIECRSETLSVSCSSHIAVECIEGIER